MVNRVALSILVRNCPCLFDEDDCEYGDKRKEGASWQAIASVLSVSVSEVKKEWTKCCELYKKYRCDANNASVDEQTMKLMQQMQFIEPYLPNSSVSYLADTPDASRRKSEGCQSDAADRKISAVRLIRQVQKHPVLYDRKHMYYRNKKKTGEAWNEIATTLEDNPQRCCTKWKNLRRSFRKYIKTHTSINKTSRGQKSHPYAKEMKFLIPVLAESVIHDTCKDQRRILENGEAVEIIEIGESDGDDTDDEDDDDEIEEGEVKVLNAEELVANGTNNHEVDSTTVNDEGKTEKRANTDEQVASNPKRLKKETHPQANHEADSLELNTNEATNNGDSNNVMEEGEEPPENEQTENEKEPELKTPKLERKSGYLDISELENDPDMLFFRSLLPELHRMTSQQKNKFRMAVLTSIDEILID